VSVVGRRFPVGLAFDLDDPLADILEFRLEVILDAVDVPLEARDVRAQAVLDGLGLRVVVVDPLRDGVDDVREPLGDDVSDLVFDVDGDGPDCPVVQVARGPVGGQQLDDDGLAVDVEFRGLRVEPLVDARGHGNSKTPFVRGLARHYGVLGTVDS